MRHAEGMARAERGLSLIELLVAMVLGLILIGGTLLVFSGNSRSARLNSAMTDMQESARFLLAALASDIRMSGYQGCLDINQGAATVRSRDAPSTDLRASATSGSVVISESVWSPAPPPGFVPADERPAVPGTHALVLQFADATRGRLSARMTSVGGAASPAGALHVDRNLGLGIGDLALISNCDTADLFTVSGVQVTSTEPAGTVLSHAATHNLDDELTRAYGDATTIGQTAVMRFHSLIYYVGDSGLVNDAGDPIRALYRQSHPYGDEDNPPVELVHGVENLRVAFGIRDDDGNLSYVLPTDTAYDPARVESMKVGLLMVSPDRVSEANDLRTYTLAGQTIAAASDASDGLAHAIDRRLRLALDTTVRIRNRRNGS